MKKISKEELKIKYESMTNKELSEELGITIPTLLKYIKENGIELKGNTGNRKIEVRIDEKEKQA